MSKKFCLKQSRTNINHEFKPMCIVLFLKITVLYDGKINAGFLKFLYSSDMCTTGNVVMKQTQSHISWIHILFETLALWTSDELLNFSVLSFFY